MKYKTTRQIVLGITVPIMLPLAILAGVISILLFPLGLITGPIAAGIVWVLLKTKNFILFRAAVASCSAGSCPECEKTIEIKNGKYRCPECGAVFALHGKQVVYPKRHPQTREPENA